MSFPGCCIVLLKSFVTQSLVNVEATIFAHGSFDMDGPPRVVRLDDLRKRPVRIRLLTMMNELRNRASSRN